MRGLRETLRTIEDKLAEIIVNRGAGDDYPELQDIVKQIHDIRVNSNLASTIAFDKINNSEQFVVAVDNNENIKVWGNSTDAFDIEIALGIIGRAKKNVNKEMLYKLFLKVMDGDFDD